MQDHGECMKIHCAIDEHVIYRFCSKNTASHRIDDSQLKMIAWRATQASVSSIKATRSDPRISGRIDQRAAAAAAAVAAAGAFSRSHEREISARSRD